MRFWITDLLLGQSPVLSSLVVLQRKLCRKVSVWQGRAREMLAVLELVVYIAG